MDQLVFDFESITHKQCVECKNSIPRCGFHRASKAKDGLQSRCKDCSRESVKKSYRKHRDKKIEKCREWRQKNLEKRKEYSSEYRKRNQENIKETMAQWRAKNSDHVKQYQKDQYLKNRERNIEVSIKYRNSHREECIKRHSEWKRKNKHKCSQYEAKRKAFKLKATPQWADSWVIDEIYAFAALKSELTGILHHVDHVVPIKSKFVCGLHCEQNLQVITWYENLKKNNSWWPDMPEKE